jgi:hypothetical protein
MIIEHLFAFFNMRLEESMKPILFNTEMVKAILDGKKTVTRRVVKQDIVNQFDCEADGTPIAFIQQSTGDHYKPTDPCRYQPGDIIYVRETWEEWTDGYVYKVPDPLAAYNYPASFIGKWKPSLHMPKEAARIFLRVKDVRIEKLQDITVEQAKKEGAFHSCSMCIHWNDYCGQNVTLARDCKIDGIAPEFPMLWDSTIDMKNHWMDHSWSANPWVWVISFERISKEEAI